MTSRITGTLHETAEAVEVPAIDQIAFRQRVRAARRRHVATRSIVAVAASVALAAGVGAVVQLRASDEPSGFAGNPGEQKSFESMQTPVPFLTDGNLMILPPGGKPVSTDIKTQDILGQVADGVIVVGYESGVLRVPLDANGKVDGPAIPILGDDAVQQAVLSKDGSTIGWIDLDDRLHIRKLNETRDLHSEQLTPEGKLVSVSADSWVVEPAQGENLRLATADDSVELDSQADPWRAELAGDTAAVETFEGVQFFAAPGGDPISTGGVGGRVGALSPDGSTYVAAASEEEVDMGMTPELTILDVQTGKRRVIPAPDGLHAATYVVWTGSNFLVSGGVGDAVRIFECSAEALTCHVLHTGERGQPFKLATN